MATTTNYGWTTPDDTALVKDGASAIRTLGSSVDTTTKALNPSTTLGDIEYRSSTANTNTRLGIGSTGQVLTVAAGVPSWATSASGGMTLISTTTLTGSSVTLSSIPSTYNHLQFVIINYKPSADGAYLMMRFNGDTTANRHFASPNRALSIDASFNATSGRMTIGQDNTSATGLLIGDVPNYANTTTWKMSYLQGLENSDVTSTNLQANYYALYYNQTTAISSLEFYPISGNFTSGTILLYGVK